MDRHVNVKLPSGEVIKRIPKVYRVGNFQMMTIRYNNSWYIIGDGDEYIRGLPDVFELGKKI